MSVGHDLQARKRLGWGSTPRHWCAIGDLHDFDQWGRSQRLAFRVGQPFSTGAVNDADTTDRVQFVLELEGVYLFEGLADIVAPRGAFQRFQHTVVQVRVGAGCVEEASVLRFEGDEGERIAEPDRGLQHQAVVGGNDEIARDGICRRNCAFALGHQQNCADQRVHIVDGLAKIDGQILALASALTPDGCGAKACPHRRDRHSRADTKVAADDRVCAGEGNLAACIADGTADVAHEGREGAGDVENLARLCDCRLGVDHCSDSEGRCSGNHVSSGYCGWFGHAVLRHAMAVQGLLG